MRSRVKSDEEYNKMLNNESDSVTFRHEKKVNDALAYFNEANERKSQEISNDPFKNIPTINDIKAQLKEKERLSVEQLKEEIALAQTNKEQERNSFNYDSNANKLYENLRANSLNNHIQKQVLQEKVAPIEQPVVQNNVTYKSDFPSQEEIASSFENSNVVLTNPMREQLAKQNVNENVNQFEQTDYLLHDKLILNAIDGKKEPSNIEAHTAQPIVVPDNIGQIEQANTDLFNDLDNQLNSLNIVDEAQPIKVEKTHSNPNAVNLDALDNLETLDNLDNLDNSLNTNATEDSFTLNEDILNDLKSDPVDEKKEIEQNDFSNEIANLNKASEKELDLSDTLSIALDQNTKYNITKSDLDILKNEEKDIDKEKPKSKVIDIIFTIVLIIMIIIVGFLITKIVFGY
ncbi:MAG: hypothetical protein LBR40_05580 [Bacilli bacterium]|jgi:hypothetical protein|nr:hypothetical protein [Bacilli bacterium]